MSWFCNNFGTPSINNVNQNRTMATNRFLKTLALPMAVALSVLAASCSKDDYILDEQQPSAAKYEIPVTVVVTRSGDDASTRANYDSGTKKLTFEEGDQLFIQGTHATAGTFAGLLSNTAGAPGTFSGTVATTNAYTGTFETLFTFASSLTAMLLPKDYSTKASGYLTLSGSSASQTITVDATKAFVTTASADAIKALAIEQLSLEQATAYSSGFALAPVNAVLNYTLSGLAASSAVTVSVSDGTTTVSGSVTTNSSGEASFAVGVAPGGTIKSYMMEKGGEQTIEFRAELSKNKVYNISRSAAGSSDCLSGVFSVASGKTVKFSKGNLKATLDGSGNVTAWSFHDTQYGMVNTAAGTQSFTSSSIDLFGWSTSATLYGINPSGEYSAYSGSFLDWGAAASKDLGYGWRTLTKDEWVYLINVDNSSSYRQVTVDGVSKAPYGLASVNGVYGLVLLPDSWDGSVHGGFTYGTSIGSYTYTESTSPKWSEMESAGCVFLPAAGSRTSENVSSVNSDGRYWSSTKAGDNKAYRPYFSNNYVTTGNDVYRHLGYSVRLVRDLN